MSSLSLLQQIFPTQGLNQGLLHCRQILYQLSYQGIPGKLNEWILNIPLYTFPNPWGPREKQNWLWNFKALSYSHMTAFSRGE